MILVFLSLVGCAPEFGLIRSDAAKGADTGGAAMDTAFDTAEDADNGGGAGESGSADSGPTDSGPTDSGPADSGSADSGPSDSGPSDSGPSDSAPRTVARRIPALRTARLVTLAGAAAEILWRGERKMIRRSRTEGRGIATKSARSTVAPRERGRRALTSVRSFGAAPSP